MQWLIPAVALSLLAFAAVSARIEGSPVTAPMAFMFVGLLLGVDGVGLVGPAVRGETVRLLAEITLALVLFADASRIDLRALRLEFRVPVRLLGIGLPLTLVAGFLVALLTFGSLDWPEALVLAVILAPTDAALGQAVVTMERIPSRIRQGLNVESGLNDGICVPIFLVALAVAFAEADTPGYGDAFTLLVEQIGYGALVGAGAGATSAAILVLAGGRGLIEPAWLQVVPLAGAALAYSAAIPIGGSGFIAAFVGGAVFGGLRRGAAPEASRLIEELGDLSGAVTFLVFGAVLLGPALGQIGWAVAGYAVLSLTVVRLVPVALAMIGTHARPVTVGFLGWFGPRGLASIVFAILLQDEGTLPHQSVVLTTVFITVGLSVLAHGVTAAPLAGRYATWYHAHPPASAPTLESGAAPEIRTRKTVPRHEPRPGGPEHPSA